MFRGTLFLYCHHDHKVLFPFTGWRDAETVCLLSPAEKPRPCEDLHRSNITNLPGAHGPVQSTKWTELFLQTIFSSC